MIKKVLLIIVVFFTIGMTKSYAGWYQCYNYEGAIGGYPITLSIQITEGYFGAEDKKEFNVNGVYKYDRFNNSIKLEGIVKNGKIRLYEMYDDQKSAIIEFDFVENRTTGYWTDLKSKKTLPLSLKYISKLIDIKGDEVFEKIEILQLHTLKDYYFVGVYSKFKNGVRATMQGIKIMSKEDNTVFQIIDFNDLDYGVGNVITIIYQNVEVSNFMENKLDVWCDVGRMGGWFTLNLDKKKNKFVPNYELHIDGPN